MRTMHRRSLILAAFGAVAIAWIVCVVSGVFLVFSVAPFKIDRNKNQNRSESGERKRADMQSPLPRFRSQQFFLSKICREKILLKFTEIYISSFPGSLILPPPGGDKMRDPGNEVEICMETPCWSTSGWALTWRP